jgi:hypothetical protein
VSYTYHFCSESIGPSLVPAHSWLQRRLGMQSLVSRQELGGDEEMRRDLGMASSPPHLWAMDTY